MTLENEPVIYYNVNMERMIQMKKLLALILSLIMVLSICPVTFAEGEADDGYDMDYEPFDDYEYFDEEGNYEPMETYLCGQLLAVDESVNINEINSVNLTVGDVTTEVPVDSNGKFSLYLPDTNGYATVSIPNEKFYVLPDKPADNNKVFSAFSEDSYKSIYVGIRSNITATVTNSDGSDKIAGASVTAFYRANEEEEWSLWMNNEFSSNANRTTDANGVFSYAVTSGQYRFVVRAEGYTNYDSASREYMQGIVPTGETTNITLHLTPDKQMSLVSITPDQGGTLHPDGAIKITFSQPVSKSMVSNYDNIRLDRVSTQNYVPFTATVNGNEVIIKADSRLMEGQKYNIILTQNITSTDGARLNMERIITFTCQKESDAVPPVDEPVVDDGGLSNLPDDISDHWSKDYMQKLIDLDIIDGSMANGIINYYPDKPLTRAEFAKYIVMSQGMETATATIGTFADGDNIPFELRPYVYGAYNSGIIQGALEDDGLYFFPDATITRAEIITILGRLLKLEGMATLDFADAYEIPDWALPYVAGCVSRGYVMGDNDTGVMLLRPNDNVTRCEAATIISKVLDDME